MSETFHFDTAAPDPGLLVQAAGIVRGSGTVIFPTETVYGIGADLRRAEAIARVFEIKCRPSGQPLLVHCSDTAQLAGLVAELPGFGQRLMAAFWPGPLALVFRAKPGLPSAVVGPGNTVGIRMVAHPVTCGLISELGAPLAGTSANLHGEPETGRFDAVSQEVLDRVDVALDAGVCGTGTASTVLDVSCSPPVLLREGAVPRQTIERLLGFSLASATRAQWNRR